MSDAGAPGVKFSIKTEAELAALQQLEASLTKQISVARALGKDYGALAGDLEKVQKAIAALPAQPPPLPDLTPPRAAASGWAEIVGQLKQVAAPLLSIGGAMLVARRAVSSGLDFLSGGIELNTQFEDTRNGLANLMGVFDDRAPANYAARVKLADQTLDSLEKKGQMAEGTLQELQAALMQSSGRMFSAGVRDLENQVDLVVAASLVMKQMNGSQVEVGPSLGALLSGTFNEQNKLAASIDLPPDKVRQLAREGKLAEEILRQWAPLLKDAKDAMGSLSSQQTIFTENVGKLQQLIASGMFEQLKGALEGINDGLGSEGAKNWATDLRDALEGASIAAVKLAGATSKPLKQDTSVGSAALDAASLLMPSAVGQTRALLDMFRRRGARAHAEREAAAEEAAADETRKAQVPLPAGTIYGVSAEDEALGRANAERMRTLELQLKLKEATAAGNDEEAKRLEMVLAYRQALTAAGDAGYGDRKWGMASRAMAATAEEQERRAQEKADKEAEKAGKETEAAAQRQAKADADEAVRSAERGMKFGDLDLAGRSASAASGSEQRKLEWLKNYKATMADLTQGVEPGTAAWNAAARAAGNLADNLQLAASAQERLNNSAAPDSNDDTGGMSGRIRNKRDRAEERAQRLEDQGSYRSAERIRKRARREAEEEAEAALQDMADRNDEGAKDKRGPMRKYFDEKRAQESAGPLLVERPPSSDIRNVDTSAAALSTAKLDASGEALTTAATALQEAATALANVGRWGA